MDALQLVRAPVHAGPWPALELPESLNRYKYSANVRMINSLGGWPHLVDGAAGTPHLLVGNFALGASTAALP